MSQYNDFRRVAGNIKRVDRNPLNKSVNHQHGRTNSQYAHLVGIFDSIRPTTGPLEGEVPEDLYFNKNHAINTNPENSDAERQTVAQRLGESQITYASRYSNEIDNSYNTTPHYETVTKPHSLGRESDEATVIAKKPIVVPIKQKSKLRIVENETIPGSSLRDSVNR